MKNIKILIIEDEKQIARFLELELEHEGYTVDIVYDGKEGLKKIEDNKYDLIILDIMIPGINGLEVCKKVRQFSDVKIIILTAKDSISDKVTGLDIGANDYMTKPFAIEELLARIRNCTKSSSKIIFNDLIIDESECKVTMMGESINLTKKEFDLLKYLINNKNIVLSRDQILNNIWGYNYYGDENIVDVYIRYLRAKIDDKFNKKLIHTIRGFGYVIKDAENEN